MSATFEQITDEDLASILAGSKQRGQYDEALMNFYKGEATAVRVSKADGSQFAGDRKAISIKTGFEGALKRAKEGKKGDWEKFELPTDYNVRVINQKEDVYLVKQPTA